MTKFGLVSGYYLMWFVYLSLAITFVISFPISAILDKVLGEEAGGLLTKNKLKRLFEMYEREKLLHPNERKLLSAALELRDKIAENVMTPLE